jgi:CubicO group peptidase (beta-lactamase class C family)
MIVTSSAPAAIEAAAPENAFTGLVTIDVGDGRVFERAWGHAHRALAIPNTATTRFGIASGSKTFTALAILRLVEDGALALDAPARAVLGDDLPLIDDRVTIEHLLTHTSGIGDYIDESADGEVTDHVLTVPVHTLDDTPSFLSAIDGFPQAFPPGERFAYCNGGYIVLALIAERVSGVPFHDLVAREVFEPAGMSSTAFLRSNELPGDAALGYLFEDGDRSNVLHLPVRGNGDGGAYTTAEDLHRFWRAFLAGRIVSAATVEQMIRPRNEVPDEELRHGMGLWLGFTDSTLILEGYDAGVSFRSTHDPASETTISVLGNSSEGAWPIVAALSQNA